MGGIGGALLLLYSGVDYTIISTSISTCMDTEYTDMEIATEEDLHQQQQQQELDQEQQQQQQQQQQQIFMTEEEKMITLPITSSAYLPLLLSFLSKNWRFIYPLLASYLIPLSFALLGRLTL